VAEAAAATAPPQASPQGARRSADLHASKFVAEAAAATAPPQASPQGARRGLDRHAAVPAADGSAAAAVGDAITQAWESGGYDVVCDLLRLNAALEEGGELSKAADPMAIIAERSGHSFQSVASSFK
jgi:hypothetical protein